VRKRISHAVGVIALLLVLNTFARVHIPRPLVMCDEEMARRAASLPMYVPTSTTDYITLRDGQFVAGDAPFSVRGVNYYPSNSPWRRFLTDTSIETVRAEFDLLRAAGLNTLRIFLWYAPLFACDGALPVPETFVFLDELIHEAAAWGLRLIVTLHDLPDLTDYPLYSNPPHTQAQTAFIVQRYREERAILAWDLRNEGDIDYGSNNPLRAQFARPLVLAWLAAMAEHVRLLDANHLLTAGWLYDSWSTARYVDFVSFHHWDNAESLQTRVNEIRTHTDKPLLLEEFGYSTYRVSEQEQADLMRRTRQAAQAANVGWLVWAAFDFPLAATCEPRPCQSLDNAEHHFGLWRADYAPKAAVEFLAPSSGSASPSPMSDS
jgi:Cellulase (glycosyl hydrolase family 5)